MNETTNRDEAHMTTPELIEAHGYVAETHQICTEDGYYLTAHRILPNDRVPSVALNTDIIINTNATVIHTKNSEDCNLSISANCPQTLETHGCYISPDSKLPVILNHGLLSSSADWVLLGPHKALAYVLCDNGYDVWLTNARGNTYSKSHKHYSIKDREFWNFSWHEIGCYDLPATIDYILEKTGHSKLYYIGHSQGAAAFYVMGSERPEYNAKVKGMISLAPAVFLGNQRSPLLKFIVYFYSILDWGAYICNIHQWLPRNKWQSRVLRTFVCNAPCTVTKGFCNCWFYLIAGFGSDQLDKSMLPLIFGHSPAGASVKQFFHFSQLIISDNCCPAVMALKFASNLSFMFTEVPNIIDRYQLAKQAGFKAVESGFPFGFSIQQVATAKKKANVDQVLLNVFTGDVTKGELGFAAIPGEEENFKESIETTIEYAKALDCKMIHVMSGKVGAPTIANDVVYEKNLLYAIEKCQKEDIVVVIEPINKYSVPNYYMNNFQKGLDLVKKMNNAYFKLLMDIFHLQHCCGNITKCVHDFLPYIGHIQIAQVPDRHEPDSPGEIDYKYVLSLLETTGYTGYVGLEYRPKSLTVEGLNWIKRYGYTL